MSATSFIKYLVFGRAPVLYQSAWFDNLSEQLRAYTFREAQPISNGWSVGTYSANSRGPIGNAPITSVSNFASGSRTIVVSAATGTQNNVPWSIKVGDVLNIEPGTAVQEFVLVTAVSGTSITATFAHAHNGSGTPYAIQVPVLGPQVVDLLLTLINDLLAAGKLGQ